MVEAKQRALDRLAASIISENIGAVLASTATQLVMGSGNPCADIVFIGEAPGKKEDEAGVPFVGASGRFLDQMLAAADMERNEVYITNIVKYRPPDNRDPSKEEKIEFWPFLIRQLEIIQPRIIITLGRHSGMQFIPDLVISRDHGMVKWVKLNGVRYMIIPLYHPAAALYNGSMRQVLIDDFIAAKRMAALAKE